jgi:hypothetical protein
LALVAGIWLVMLGVIEVVAGLSMRGDVKNVEKSFNLGARPHAVAS